MPEAQVIKQEIRNACLLKQVNVIGLLKVGASIQVTQSAEIFLSLYLGGNVETDKQRNSILLCVECN